MVRSQKGMGLTFPWITGWIFVSNPSSWAKKGGLDVKYTVSVSKRKTAFFLKMEVGSGKEQGIPSKDTTELMIRSNLSYVHRLLPLQLAFTSHPSPPRSLVSSYLLPSFLPLFFYWTQIRSDQKLSRVWLFATPWIANPLIFIVRSILFLVPGSQSWTRHTELLSAFSITTGLCLPLVHPHVPSSCMKLFMNTSAHSDLSLLSRVFTIPEAACQFMQNLVWENAKMSRGRFWTLKAS